MARAGPGEVSPLPGPRQGAGASCPLCPGPAAGSGHPGSRAGSAPRAVVGAGWTGDLAVVILGLSGLGEEEEESPFPPAIGMGVNPAPVLQGGPPPPGGHDRVCDPGPDGCRDGG